MKETKPHIVHDPRMQGFARRHTVKAALAWLDAQLHPLDAEDVPLRTAAGRVLASLVVSDIDVPGFDRATMDGYAVVADSTEGATPYNTLECGTVIRGAALSLAVRISKRCDSLSQTRFFRPLNCYC